MQWFWNKKHNDQEVFIHGDCHKKLSKELKKQFRPISGNNITHAVRVEDDDFLLYPLGSADPGIPLNESVNDGNSLTGHDFDGGSGGGAGATGSWEAGSQNVMEHPVQSDPQFDPLPAYQSDSQPSYDPGAASDSTIDSGSTSGDGGGGGGGDN